MIQIRKKYAFDYENYTKGKVTLYNLAFLPVLEDYDNGQSFLCKPAQYSGSWDECFKSKTDEMVLAEDELNLIHEFTQNSLIPEMRNNGYNDIKLHEIIDSPVPSGAVEIEGFLGTKIIQELIIDIPEAWKKSKVLDT